MPALRVLRTVPELARARRRAHVSRSSASPRLALPRIARFLFNSDFGEGWALYAERLADELGPYTDDASRMGMLSNAAWRACRLIVDSGLHAMRWDRARAIALLLEHTAMARAQAAQEVDSYISWPGQAASYMTGYLEIAVSAPRRRRPWGRGSLGDGSTTGCWRTARCRARCCGGGSSGGLRAVESPGGEWLRKGAGRGAEARCGRIAVPYGTPRTGLSL